MIDRPRFLPQVAGPGDLTLDAPYDTNPAAERRVFAPAAENPPCHVHLVEGSGPCLSSETQTLLRTRLRVAAMALVFGFATFAVWQLLYVEVFARWDSMTIFAAHWAVMLTIAAAGASLCRGCTICTKNLRLYELLIFALPAAYLALVQAVRMQSTADAANLLLSSLSAGAEDSLAATPSA
jgi:hypothetical protein